MTRDELKENICGMTHDDMFEYIYSIESRTCENCIYSKPNEYEALYCSLIEISGSSYVDDKWFCAEYEEKPNGQ